ncbi:AlpA family transcriptional regulator [Desulfoprunum benzoelyticum]|nr:AlpA family transcriptional regulator [Desulfoprunum benzoelyticum]MBM9528859.1 AlpA family transcriptional regulator [Desulfoprunum benzoelyticum]
MKNTDTLLRLSQVEAIVGLKKSKIYNLIQNKEFPEPFRLGKRSVRWTESAVQAWIQSLSSAGQAHPNDCSQGRS